MKKSIVLLTLSLTLLFGCKDKEIDANNLNFRNNSFYEVNQTKPFSGKVFSKYPNSNQLIFEAGIKNGKYDGEFKQYNEKGQIIMLLDLKNGKINKNMKVYHENGQLAMEMEFLDNLDLVNEINLNYILSRLEDNFSMGSLEDIGVDLIKNRELKLKVYQESGLPIISTGLKNLQPEGENKEYYENGQLKSQGTFKDGKFEGSYEEYYPNGQLKTKTTYQNGHIEGPYSDYYSNGQLKNEADNYSGDFFNSNFIAENNFKGNFKKYSQQGEIITSYDFPKKNIIKTDFSFLNLNKDSNLKWGYTDNQGNTIIPYLYDDAENFNDGLAAVKRNNKWGYIDTKGNIVIPFIYSEGRTFHDGLAAVRKDYEWGYIDTDGEEVIPFIYENITSFENGFARVRKGYKWGAINTRGDEVIPFIYDSANSLEIPIINAINNSKIKYETPVQSKKEIGLQELIGGWIMREGGYSAEIELSKSNSQNSLDITINTLVEPSYHFGSFEGTVSFMSGEILPKDEYKGYDWSYSSDVSAYEDAIGTKDKFVIKDSNNQIVGYLEKNKNILRMYTFTNLCEIEGGSCGLNAFIKDGKFTK